MARSREFSQSIVLPRKPGVPTAVSPQTAQTNAALRNGFRIGGLVLLVVGLVVFLYNGSHVVHAISDSSDMSSPHFAEGPSVGSMLATMGGFLLIGISLQLLNLGFLRPAVNYAAGEGSEAIRSVSGDIAGGIREGLAGPGGPGGTGGGVGASERTGPYCSKCGVRNAAGAHFCDACGTALVAP